MGHCLGSIDRIKFAGSVVQVMIDRMFRKIENLGRFQPMSCLRKSRSGTRVHARFRGESAFTGFGRNLTQLLMHQMDHKEPIQRFSLMLMGKRLPRKNTAAGP